MDTLFYNAKIDTRDCRSTAAEAIGIADGNIVFIGTKEEGEKLHPKEKIDLKGAYVLPGFCDSHLHMLNYAFVTSAYAMYDVTSIKEIQETGRRMAEERGLAKTGKWLFGRGWNQERFTDEKRYLTKEDLDAISTEFPIFFIRTCGHLATANTEALKRILALEKTKNYRHFIDEATGTLLEASVKLVYDAMTPPTQEEVEDLIQLAARDLNACGITSVQTDDFLSLPGRDGKTIINAYHALQSKGRLNVRVYEQAAFTKLEDVEDFLTWGYRTGMGGPYFKMGPLKLLQDGGLGAHTALLREPYADAPDEKGIQVHETETFYKMVKAGHDAGMQIAVHTIGDGALEMTMDAIKAAQEANPRSDCRHGAVHAQITDHALVQRMADEEIVGYIQPVFFEDDIGVCERCVGLARTAQSYAWKTMLDKGVHICGGSDAPVCSFHLLENIQYAVTRQKKDGTPKGGWYPAERLSVDEAIDLFTKNTAYSSFQEDVRGTLEVGKWADMVVLDRDPHQVAPDEIGNISVLRTVVGGRTVYMK